MFLDKNMKTRDIARFIARANKKHDEFKSLCEVLATEAQKYVDWGKINCGYFPTAGVCVFDDVIFDFVKAELFFKYVREHDNKPMTIEEYRNLVFDNFKENFNE